MFGTPLNVEPSFINHIPVEQFTRRMFDLDVNKKTIPRLNECRSEYLILDFFSMTRDLLKITKGSLTAYVNNNSYTRIHTYINSLNDPNFRSEIVTMDQISRDIILDGIDKLADFARRTYDPTKIVVVNPIFHLKYCNKFGNIIPYTPEEQTLITKKQNIVNSYTQYFMEKIPEATFFLPKTTKDYSSYRITDLGVTKPIFTHHPKYEEIQFAYQLYNLIFHQKLDCPTYQLLTKEYDILTYTAYKLANIVSKTAFETITSLNNYFYDVLDLDKYIVIISSKDDASTHLHKFIAKDKLSLSFPISFRDSYIGIVDKVRNYYFEQASPNSLTQIYNIGENSISISSSGYLCGNISSIIINGKEFSPNKRGLNFVIIDNETFEVVNQFNCDSHADENLIISLHPKY